MTATHSDDSGALLRIIRIPRPLTNEVSEAKDRGIGKIYEVLINF